MQLPPLAQIRLIGCVRASRGGSSVAAAPLPAQVLTACIHQCAGLCLSTICGTSPASASNKAPRCTSVQAHPVLSCAPRGIPLLWSLLPAQPIWHVSASTCMQLPGAPPQDTAATALLINCSGLASGGASSGAAEVPPPDGTLGATLLQVGAGGSLPHPVSACTMYRCVRLWLHALAWHLEAARCTMHSPSQAHVSSSSRHSVYGPTSSGVLRQFALCCMDEGQAHTAWHCTYHYRRAEALHPCDL